MQLSKTISFDDPIVLSVGAIGIICLWVWFVISRKAVLFPYLALLPLLGVSIIQERIAGIPGLSITNVIMLLGVFLLIKLPNCRAISDGWLRAGFIVYWVVTLMAVFHSVFYLEEFAKRNPLEQEGLYPFLRGALLRPFLTWLSFVMVLRFINSGGERAMRVALRYAAFSAVIFAMLMLGATAYYFGQSGDLNIVRDKVAEVVGTHSNDFAVMFVILVPFLLACIFDKKVSGVDKVLFISSLGIVMVAVLFSYSRSAYVAVAIIFAIYSMFFNRKLLFIVLPLLALAPFVIPDSVIERSLSGMAEKGARGGLDLNALSAGRIGLWQKAYEAWVSDTWYIAFGAGRYSFSRLVRLTGHPHNAYIEALLDAGVLCAGGLLFIYWRLYSIISAKIKFARDSQFFQYFFAGKVALLSYLILAFSGRTFFPSVQLAFFWIIMGIVLGISGFAETGEKQNS